MNILFASFDPHFFDARAIHTFDFQTILTIRRYQITDPVVETALFSILSWADVVYCKTVQEQQILGFMQAFQSKIQVA